MWKSTGTKPEIRMLYVDLKTYCKLFDIPEPVQEFKFHPVRKWRIDLAWPERKLAVEIEGGIYGSKRTGQAFGWHQSIQRMKSDMEKYNALTFAGFRLLRFTPEQVSMGIAFKIIKEFFTKEDKK